MSSEACHYQATGDLVCEQFVCEQFVCEQRESFGRFEDNAVQSAKRAYEQALLTSRALVQEAIKRDKRFERAINDGRFRSAMQDLLMKNPIKFAQVFAQAMRDPRFFEKVDQNPMRFAQAMQHQMR